jgi:hypothetical protein
MAFLLRHIGGGTLEPVKASERQDIIARFPVGENVRCAVAKYRSRKQNKALHAAIAKALHNVPEDQEGRWQDEDHLRHWCFLRVGFKDTIVHHITVRMTPQDVKLLSGTVVELRKNYRDKGIYTEIRVVPEGLALDIPRSWAFTRAQHRAATRVMDAVLDLLVAQVVPGITREQLLEAVHKDAA